MGRKFYIYAAISSPLLALYGSSPFYMFGVMDLSQTGKLCFSVLVSVILYWLINGFLFLRLQKPRNWYFLLLSYVATFLSNILKAPFQRFAEFQSTILEYVLFPITMTLALNTIILLMINLIIEEREKRAAKSRVSELTIQKLEAENMVLMQQLQPHFLFNALSVLKSLIKEDGDLAEEYSIKLSDFLRYAVDSHNAKLVSLSDEMDFVSNYIDLQKIRFEDAFDFTVEVPNEIRDFQIPVLAIQTLVENAFKHNYFTEKRPLHIRINYENEVLQVHNNIVSLKVTERAGTGLVNLSKRVEFLTGKELQIEQTEAHFLVQIPVIAR
ncbi:MAG: histidine kinase [Bacteroidota bacterium]